MRPFHDLRHTAITNDAAAGSSPIAVMTKAGHTDMRTTKRYLHLAGGRAARAALRARVAFYRSAYRTHRRGRSRAGSYCQVGSRGDALVAATPKPALLVRAA